MSTVMPSRALAEVAPLGDGIAASAGMWTFKGAAALHFDDHISKSVPLYHEGHALVCDLSDFFVGSNSTCYEIGCSTATLLTALAARHADKSARFVGIDIEREMVDIAREKCAGIANIEIVHHDALSFEFCKSDLFVSYYTIQFIQPKDRQIILNKIFESLNFCGALLLFEKTRAPDAKFQDIATQAYTEYKLSNGYSEKEIIGKARSLKGVLEPLPSDTITGMLRRAGFSSVMTVMKYLCFEGFLAIK